MAPLVSGNTSNSQTNSILLPAESASVILNGSGEYFLWLGTEILDMELMEIGDYVGQFTVTVEYDL